MDDFDRKLSELPWREPSPALQERIFGGSPTPQPARPFWRKSVDMGWAAALSVVVGFAGFVAGSLLSNENAPPVTTTSKVPVRLVSAETDLRVVETYRAQNSFDFSSAGGQILLPGELTAYVEDAEEAEQ